MSKKRTRVLIVDPVHTSLIPAMDNLYDVVEFLNPDQHTLQQLLPSVDAIILRSGIKLGVDEFEVASNLRFVARAGVGIDNIDLISASSRGIAVFNVPDISSVSVAEFTFALILAIVRKVTLADRQLRAGEWRKSELSGIELSGKTIGILGFGRIGRCVARIASGFGMQVLVSVEKPSKERAITLAADSIELVPTERLLETADVISLHCPLTPASRSLIDAKALSRVKQGAFLVNMSRGGIVDEAALYDALMWGRLAGAATDVFAHERKASPLTTLDNFIATPHIGAMTEEAQKRIADFLLSNLERGFSGDPIFNRIV